MSIQTDQLQFIINLLLRRQMIQEGRMPVPEELQTYIGEMGARSGTPMMTPRLVNRGMTSNPDLFQQTFEELGFDLNLLFYTARRDATDLISGFTYNHVQMETLYLRALSLQKDANTILLINDKTTGMLDYIYEDFNDLTNIDTNLTSAEVDTAAKVVRLGATGVESKLTVTNATITLSATETLEGKGVSLVSYTKIAGSGDWAAIFDDYLNSFYGVQVQKVTDGPIQWIMTVDLPDQQEIGRVDLDIKFQKTAPVGLTVVDKDGNQEFRGLQYGQGLVEWRFSSRKVKQLIFTFETAANSKQKDLFEFYLIIVNLSLYLDAIKGESDLYTKQMALQFNNRVDRLSLVTTQEGSITWYAKIWYKETDASLTESAWLPIRPAELARQGDPIILDSLSDIRPDTVTLGADGVGMSAVIDGYITADSLKFTDGLDLWRVDYQEGNFVDGRYIPGNGSIDMQVAHTGYLPVSGLSHDTQTSVFKVEMFHRFRFSSVVYIEPATFREKTYHVTIKTSTPYTQAPVTKNRYQVPIMQVHSVTTVQQTVSGIDTVTVPLVQADYTDIGGDTGYVYTADVTLHEGINYVMLYFDTGIDQVTLGEKELAKSSPMKISFAVSDDATLTHGLEYFKLSAGDFIFAAPADPADVQLNRHVIPYVKLSSKFAYDYKSVAVEDIESPGLAQSSFYINHPFYALPTYAPGLYPKPAPSETMPSVNARVSYKKLVREVSKVQLWAHLRKSDVLPTITNFALRFAI